MNYQEFNDRADREMKQFMAYYLMVQGKLFELNKSNAIKYKNGKPLDEIENYLFMFFYTLFLFNSCHNFNMSNEDINPLKYYDIPSEVITICSNLKHNKDYNENIIERLYGARIPSIKFIRDILSKCPKTISTERLFLVLKKTYSRYLSHLNNAFDLRYVERFIYEDAQRKDNYPQYGEKKEVINLSVGEELTKKTYVSDPLIGRKAELRTLGAFLLDHRKSVLLKGAPGVGKTAIVEGLCYRIQNGMAHPKLNSKRVFCVSATDLIAGTNLRGSLEDKFLELMEDLSQMGNGILFIDEMHMLLGAGGSTQDKNMDLSNMFKPYVGSGKVKIIGATTDEEYGLIAANSAFARRFKIVNISHLTKGDLYTIVDKTIANYRIYDGIDFPYTELEQMELINLLVELENPKYQEAPFKHNPDLILTMLSNSYNFAEYDGKDYISYDYLIEGMAQMEEINSAGKNYFMSEIPSRVRKK